MPDEQEFSSLVIRAIQQLMENDSIAALATLIEGPSNVGAKILIEEGGATSGSLGNPRIDAAVREQASRFLESREEARVFEVREFAPQLVEWGQGRVLFERLQPEAHLVICGAGHVGAALARLASFIGYRTTLIDDRPEFVARELFPDERINLVSTEDWANAVVRAVGNGRGVAVAIVTRGHNEDEQCIRALINTDPDYVGLIGSKRRTNIVLERLREAGASAEFQERVRAPIGLDIAAVTPEEVALAILAEVVAQRRGGKGGSLSSWRRREREKEKR
jgi:xanthine dehydrogenase accessory factor